MRNVCEVTFDLVVLPKLYTVQLRHFFTNIMTWAMQGHLCSTCKGRALRHCSYDSREDVIADTEHFESIVKTLMTLFICLVVFCLHELRNLKQSEPCRIAFVPRMFSQTCRANILNLCCFWSDFTQV